MKLMAKTDFQVLQARESLYADSNQQHDSRSSRRRHLTQTPDLESNQFYLNPSPGGIDAQTAWTKPGGTGAGIKVYDVEYEWNQYHEDLGLQDESPILVTGM